MNEKAIRAKTDEKTRLELLINFEPLIKKTIQQYVKDFNLFPDAMQEGYCTILKCIQQYRPDSGINFPSYVKVAMSHNLIHFVNKQKATLSLDCECDSTDGLTLLDMLPSDTNIEEAELRKLERISLRNAIHSLDEHHRNLLYALYIKRRTIGSISQEYGYHYNTVINKRERALKALRIFMRDVL